MNTKRSLTILVIFSAMFVVTTISSSWLYSTVAAKTTHSYCYSAHAVFGGHQRCFDTLAGCQQDRAAFSAANPAFYVVGDCLKATNTDKTTNNYCFEFGAPGGPLSCYSSKKECESQRQLELTGFNGYRVFSECSKI